MNEALWLLGRGLGVSTLVLLTISMVAGIITWQRSTPLRPAVRGGGDPPPRLARGLGPARRPHPQPGPRPGGPAELGRHRRPFLNARNPLWWGLGTLSLDILLVVVVTSLLKERISHRVWRGIHWFSLSRVAGRGATPSAAHRRDDGVVPPHRLHVHRRGRGSGRHPPQRYPATAGAARRAV